MSKRAINLVICAVILVLVIVAVFSVVNMKNKFDVVEDVSEVKEEAIALYAEGNKEEALSRLEIYCKHTVTDAEAKILLGDWHMEMGNEYEAVEKYYEAAITRKHEEKDYIFLSNKSLSSVVDEPIQNIVMEITPDIRQTKNMTLTITSHNLAPEKIYSGKIEEDNILLTEDENYCTTEWFSVDPEGKYLTVSGGFNCAIWQFRDKNGVIIAWAQSNNKYRRTDSYDVNVYQMTRANIPKNAAECRITYLDKREEERTALEGESLTIVYGKLPGESQTADFAFYEIPDIKEGEKITLKDGMWFFSDENGEAPIEGWKVPTIEKGSRILIGGTLPGQISFEKSTYATYDKDGIYTIAFNLMNPSATGQRLDDAKNLAFNAAVGETFLTAGENHFDNIYPWSEMKLCTISGEEIIYEGEEGFNDSGNNGDVFVEIPKFYTRRVVEDGYEKISISGKKHEGFSLEEAFVTKKGEVDKIYIAAYLTSENNSTFISGADFPPKVSMTPEETILGTESKGEGYYEIDYAAISALQKLFMVETGIRNSQYIFMGICGYSQPSNEPDKVSVAIGDRTKTNCIEVVATQTFISGNDIVIYDITDYENSMKEGIKDIRRITTVIRNSDGTQSIFFSGDPIEVTKGKTAIAHFATTNGKTGSVSYHTGAVATSRGTDAFKYRNIENLWGNVYVYVDNVSVDGRNIVLTERNGEEYTLSYLLPENRESVLDTIINELGYDEKKPQVMLPEIIGYGATTSTYYGDSFLDWRTEEGGKHLYYGGAWNNKATAGLFSYMVCDGKDRLTLGGRMMYIK